MVEPDDGGLALAAELAARGTDASPLEVVLEPAPPPLPPPDDLAEASAAPLARGDAGEGEAGAFSGSPEAEATSPEPAEVETYYELLGVSPQASREQIEKAHRFCLDMYKDGALATYSLLEAGDAEEARRRISLAYETLANPVRRQAYDLSLGLSPSPGPGAPTAPEATPAHAPVPAPGAPLPEGPLSGAQLRRIRESRGIALREVAATTKIGLRFLEYIEADRFALLPPAVYLRGFLSEYSRLLGLDPRRATEAYMSRVPGRD